VRRLALRHGDAMAFEPNDAITRRAVRRSFQALLGRMFELGAFAGNTADEGFRVDTPASAADLDGGRLVVELRVAPARPLSFLTVRLVRSGAGDLHVEGR
jgi:phage tail sheath protein FI